MLTQAVLKNSRDSGTRAVKPRGFNSFPVPNELGTNLGKLGQCATRRLGQRQKKGAEIALKRLYFECLPGEKKETNCQWT